MVSVRTEAGSERDPSLRRVELSDGSLFSFRTVYLPPEYDPENLCSPGRDLSGAEAESLRFAASCYRAERAALRLVARAEQCVFGLSGKLEARSYTGPCVRAVLARLCALEIVSDERFAASWCRSRLNRTGGRIPGPRDLTLALCRRGVSRETAQKALKSVLTPDAELSLLRRYLAGQRRGKAGTGVGVGEGEGPKQASPPDRFLWHDLKQAGFSPAVLEILREEGEL
ncbi:MAG: RecX family transcriptional regulator [Spirochaetaceae bacterium]|nr:RecX family transcriptional regulator [Spirochaetaceae bacterium]